MTAGLIGLGATAEAGTTLHWNLFNPESENADPAIFAPYATRDDMLNRHNRSGAGFPEAGLGHLSASDIVATGAFGVADSTVSPVPLPTGAWGRLSGLGRLPALSSHRRSRLAA